MSDAPAARITLARGHVGRPLARRLAGCGHWLVLHEPGDCIDVVPCAEQSCSVKYGHRSSAKPEPNIAASLEERLAHPSTLGDSDGLEQAPVEL